MLKSAEFTNAKNTFSRALSNKLTPPPIEFTRRT